MRKIIEHIDAVLNNYTMYRVVLYGLMVLSGVAIIFGFLGWLPFTGIDLSILLLLVTLSTYLSHVFAAKIFGAITNKESFLITALILFLILAPVTNVEDLLVTVAVSVFAIFSKYLLAVDKKHLFNPVAIALVVMGLLGFGNAIWWVGSIVLLPVVLVIGLLMVRKIRRFYLLWPFLGVALFTTTLFNVGNGMAPVVSLYQVITSWPLLFFGTVMLTEPLTTPGRKRDSIIYASIVGVLFGSQYHFGPVHATPELALVLGNVFSYIVSSRENLMLQLQSQKKIGADLYEFVLGPKGTFSFLPGQYLEWTLDLAQSDDRGNRRFFTIASSPTEEHLTIAVKITAKASAYKQKLRQLEKGDAILATHLAGDFILPEDQSQKLIFIAGGIGVTPFRSMIKYLIDKKQHRDIVLFYVASHPAEFAYESVFEEAKKVGVTIVYVVTRRENVPKNWSGEVGYMTKDMLERYAPDFTQRVFYLSGPNQMVDSCCGILSQLNLADGQIKTDYFPGF